MLCDFWPLTFDLAGVWLGGTSWLAAEVRNLVVKFHPFTFFPLCLWPPDLLSLLLLSFCCQCPTILWSTCSFPITSSAPNCQGIRFCTRMTSHSNLFRPSLPTCLSVGIITGNWDGGMWGKKRSVRRKQLPMFPSAAVTATWALLFINGAVTSTFMAFQLLPYRGNKVSGRSALRTAAVQIK